MSAMMKQFLSGRGFPNQLIIDSHTHVARGRKYGLGRSIEETAGRTIDKMDAVGIDACCVMGSLYVIEGDYREGNDDLLWLHRSHPDRFICFASINPHDKAQKVLSELKRMYDAGIRGIKLNNTYQNYPSDGPVLWELYEFAARHGLVVLSHSWGNLESTERIARSFPEMTMIMGHHTDRADDLLRCLPNLYMCTWVFVRPGQIEKTIRRIGSAKLLYGSDALLNPFAAGLGPVLFARVTDPERAAILGLNMAAILARVGYLHSSLQEKWLQIVALAQRSSREEQRHNSGSVG